MNQNRCIVIQGPTSPTHKESIKEAWIGFPIIWSCWEGEENYYTKYDTVIFNSKSDINPNGHTLEFQRKTTLNGLLKAKELGYERVFKWRSDMEPTNATEFIKLLDNDKLNIHSFHNHHEGYILDFFMEGDIDDVIKLFTFKEAGYSYPEQALTEQLVANRLHTKSHCIKDYLTKENDVIWHKYGHLFSKIVGQVKYTNELPSQWKTNKKLVTDMSFRFTINGKESEIKINLFE